jgi:hypothetical protein
MDAEFDGIVISICTPLMKRIHRLVRGSGELIFVDAGGNMDRQNARVFLMLTHSTAGGLPLGVLIVSDERQSTVTRALNLFNTMLDDSCFGGKGLAGPNLIMTDDSSAERNALSSVYPTSTLLLCSFHVLQAYWRYLWDSKNGIKKEHRQHLLAVLKDMVYAETVELFDCKYEDAINNSTVNKYPRLGEHLQSLHERRVEWALCFRSDIPVRGNNTNSYCERAMKVMKDSVLHRTKAFNIQQLLDFVVTRLD